MTFRNVSITYVLTFCVILLKGLVYLPSFSSVFIIFVGLCSIGVLLSGVFHAFDVDYFGTIETYNVFKFTKRWSVFFLAGALVNVVLILSFSSFTEIDGIAMIDDQGLYYLDSHGHRASELSKSEFAQIKRVEQAGFFSFVLLAYSIGQMLLLVSRNNKEIS